MQTLKMISSLVFLIRPPRALSRLLTRLFAAIVQGVRPSTAAARTLYVSLGVGMLFGAFGAERDGQRSYAIAMAATGVVLLILRRRPQNEPKVEFWNRRIKVQIPSDLLMSGWTRKGVAVNGRGDPVLSDDPAAAAWSLCGAVSAVYEADSPLWKSYMAALQAQVGHNIVRWNGASGRTQGEAVAAALEAEKIVRQTGDGDEL